MKNQDRPAHPQAGSSITGDFCSDDFGGQGETKREKAFWQVYNAMISDPSNIDTEYKDLARYALAAVNAGFKALEQDGDKYE